MGRRPDRDLLLNALRQRDGNQCCWCKVPDPFPPSLEHLKPKNKGGEAHLYNLALACRACNRARKHHTAPPPGAQNTSTRDPRQPFSIRLTKSRLAITLSVTRRMVTAAAGPHPEPHRHSETHHDLVGLDAHTAINVLAQQGWTIPPSVMNINEAIDAFTTARKNLTAAFGLTGGLGYPLRDMREYHWLKNGNTIAFWDDQNLADAKAEAEADGKDHNDPSSLYPVYSARTYPDRVWTTATHSLFVARDNGVVAAMVFDNNKNLAP